MVNKGWSNADLNAMDDGEFIAVFEDQIAFDEASAEAQQKAIDKAGRK